MDEPKEEAKPAPVMDVIAPPATPAAETPAPESPEPVPAPERTAEEKAEVAKASPVEQPAPSAKPTVQHDSNPALPAIIVTVIIMVVLSSLAIYAYLKQVR